MTFRVSFTQKEYDAIRCLVEYGNTDLKKLRDKMARVVERVVEPVFSCYEAMEVAREIIGRRLKLPVVPSGPWQKKMTNQLASMCVTKEMFSTACRAAQVVWSGDINFDTLVYKAHYLAVDEKAANGTVKRSHAVGFWEDEE
jgi:hypothetical protein